MDRISRQLTDSAIDLEIQTLLAVDPSPEFPARLRARIASELARSPFRARPVFLTTCVIAAAVLLVVVLSRPHLNWTSTDQPPIQSQSFNHSLTLLPETPAPVGEAVMGSKHPRPVSKVRRPVPVTPLVDHFEPEVLISVGEAKALNRFLVNIREGRAELSTAVLPTTTETFTELGDIHPLIPITIQEGVLQ